MAFASAKCLDARDIVGVTDAQHIPAIAQEARRNVFGERNACCRGIEGDVIVVVDPASGRSRYEMRGKGGKPSGADALHQAAVAAYHGML